MAANPRPAITYDMISVSWWTSDTAGLGWTVGVVVRTVMSTPSRTSASFRKGQKIMSVIVSPRDLPSVKSWIVSIRL